MSIFKSDLALVALVVLEGWDQNCSHEIQMDANRQIIMRCNVVWRPSVHCDFCCMCAYSVTISEGEWDGGAPQTRVGGGLK